MKIVKIIHGYPPNYNAGSEVYSQSICNELSKSHRVTVFTREENPYVSEHKVRHYRQHDNLDFYLFNNPHNKDGYRHTQLDTAFSEILSNIKPDIAHIGHLNHLSTGLVDELNKQRIPIVFTLHDFWLMCPRGQFLTRSIGKDNLRQLCDRQEDRKCAVDCYSVYFSGRGADEGNDLDHWTSWIHQRMLETIGIVDKVELFLAPSHYLRDRFIKDFGVPASKIAYLDYGFPTEYLTHTRNAKDRENYTFGYIGTHIPAKGVNQLIEAFKQVKKPAVLKIFGRQNGQSTNALREMASSSMNRIEFAGEFINRNLANEVFSKVDCIIVPSIWGENSPLVIHEAQACRIPVITADFGGMKEYVHNNVNGLLFEHRNAKSLADQMNFAVEHPQRMKTLGERGYLCSQDGDVHTIQDHCKELVKLYERYSRTSKFWRITIDTNPEDCNLKCIMCEEHSPHSNYIQRLQESSGVKRRRMPIETVEKIFAEAKKLKVQEIIPSTMGEPLLYKGIGRFFELSQMHNIKINLTTNGTFPTKKIEEWAKIIVPNSTDVKISWNGATEKTVESIMQGAKFSSQLENIKSLIAFRDEHHNKTGYYCRISFQLTFMQTNMHELVDIVRLAAELGVDRIKGHHLWAHFDEIKAMSMKATSESVDRWNGYVKQAYLVQDRFRKPNGEKIVLENIIPIHGNGHSDVPFDYECPFLTKELWISATGDISPCCAPDDLRRSLGFFGNIATTSIHDVLQSSTYLDLVENYKSNSLCKTCHMRKPP